MNQKTNTPNQSSEKATPKADETVDKKNTKSGSASTDKPLTQVETKSASKPVDKAVDKAVNKAAAKKSSGNALQYILLLLIIALVVGIWFIHNQTTQQITSIEQQLQQQTEQTKLAINQSKQAIDALDKQNQQIDLLNKGLNQSKNDFHSLNKAFQLVAERGSDLILLNDIEHLVTIAQQQLQLSGNVANAIISLETAQAQLSRVNKPEFASLQQTLNGDLDRLRTAATVDVSLLSGSLDELAGLVLQAPLLVPDQAVPAIESQLKNSITEKNNNDTSSIVDTTYESENWWQQLPAKAWQWSVETASTIKYDLNQFVSVRRVDDASALLISPDQATRFRDNLRLRIMTAQLALMMGQSQVWHTETSAVLDAIQTRFDKDSSITRKAIKIARLVADAQIDVKIPTVNNTVNAINAIRESDTAQSNNAE